MDNQLFKKLRVYFNRILGILPESMSELDTSRLVIMLFATNGLSLLNSLEDVNKAELIEFIYAHQILASGISDSGAGFRGSSFVGSSCDPQIVKLNRCEYDCSHVTMVYAALCSLLALGDDLSRVDRLGTLRGIAALQCSDEPGLFQASLICTERDMRFVFSAVASCFILDGLHAINIENITDFISSCMTYEGGFAQLPNLEAHAGATYCALASLALLGKLDDVLPKDSHSRERLIKWLINLQSNGFHGRIGKRDDTCYTYWVCASLKILGCEDLIKIAPVIRFVCSCWNQPVGAIGKYPDNSCIPDPLHTYLCLSGLSCIRENRLDQSSQLFETHTINSTCKNDKHFELDGNVKFDSLIEHYFLLFRDLLNSKQFGVICPQLNITETAFNHLKLIHADWRNGSIRD